MPTRTLQATYSEIAIELPGFFLVSQARFTEFARVGIHVRNLLEARIDGESIRSADVNSSPFPTTGSSHFL